MIINGEMGLDLARLIYDINQDLKNSKKESDYTIFKGKFISFKTGNEDMVHNIGTPILSKKRKKLEDCLQDINGYVSGDELFGFFKEHKKFITEVELQPDYFVIRTSIPEVEYKSGSVRYNQHCDIEPYKDFLQRVLKKYKTKKQLIGKVTLDKEEMESLKTANAPIIIGTAMKGLEVRFKATHRLFLGMKAKSNIEIMFFEISKDENLYLVDIIMENPHFKSDNYFVIVNY